MLFKKVVCNGLSLELNTPFDFQVRTWSVPFFNSNYQPINKGVWRFIFTCKIMLN